jgi:DNA-binding helix-hairpin-helix protein with protein kinase domain
MELLRPRQRVRAELSGSPCEVECFLGGGGQGEVYRVSLAGTPLAVKWYFPHTASRAQRAALEALVQSGPPNDKFLWPLELASADGVPGFGYLMLLRGPEYAGIVALMKGRARPTFRALATAGMELADSFLQLHARGLCYRDISFGNVFFNPQTGGVLICDNDNVTVNRSAGSVGVLGTPRFMAPEIVRGEAQPSTETDLFSLAVLLFYMFLLHHPLEGKKEAAIRCFDLPAQRKLYGSEPLFVFDPADPSNRPDPTYHQTVLGRWPIYPRFLQDLFTQSFTRGLSDPSQGRVRESEWRQAMARLRDAIVYGPTGAENFYCVEQVKQHGKLRPCWATGQEIPLPFRIQIGRHLVVLNPDTKLYPHHVDDARLWDFREPVAEVQRHPSKPGLWGLKNLGKDRWLAATPAGESREVEPGRSISLAAGTKVNFGSAEGEMLR